MVNENIKLHLKCSNNLQLLKLLQNIRHFLGPRQVQINIGYFYSYIFVHLTGKKKLHHLFKIFFLTLTSEFH